MPYRIAVTYAAGNTQEHVGLSPEQAEQGAGAFLRDLINLRGAGVRAVTVTLDDGRQSMTGLIRQEQGDWVELQVGDKPTHVAIPVPPAGRDVE